MSLFWDLLQDHRYFKDRDKGDSFERRVQTLEKQASDLQDLLRQVLHALETHLGEDINKDGLIGKPPKKRIMLRRTAQKNERSLSAKKPK